MQLLNPACWPNRYWTILAATILIFGGGVRIWNWYNRNAFWHDEAALAINVVDRPWSQLASSPDRDQVAPLGFIAISKIAANIAVPTERVLRFLPLLSGIVGLWLLYRLGSQVAGRTTGVVLMLLATISARLIYYASEFKPYTTDLAIAALILCTTLWISNKPLNLGRCVVLACVGILVVWISFPSIFMLASAGGFLVVDAAIRKDRRRIATLMGIGFLWLASFGLHYFTFMRERANNTQIADPFSPGFMPFPPRSLADLRWAPAKLCYALVTPCGLDFRYLAAAALVAGCLVLIYRGAWPTVAMLVAPIAMALVVSGMRKYPFMDRLILFLIPSMLIPIAVLIAAGLDSKRFWLRAAGLILLFILTVRPLASLGSSIYPIHRAADIRDVTRQLKARWQPGEPIYVQWQTDATFEWYSRRYGFDRPTVLGVPREQEREVGAADVAQFAGSPRVWLLLPTFVPRDGSAPIREVLVEWLDRHGRQLECIPAEGVVLYLYDLRVTGN